jgi:hypothetical protein
MLRKEKEMLDHVLNLWIALPFSAAITFTGAFLRYSGRQTHITPAGIQIIEVPPPLVVRLRQSAKLAGIVMGVALIAGWLLALAIPFPLVH